MKTINYKKGQSISIDVMVVLAVVLLGIVFLVANKLNSTNSDRDSFVNLDQKASEQSRVLVDELKTKNIIDSENNVNVESLMQINFQQIKEDLNIDTDFCIVFEKDGKLVKIDPENNVNGIGSEKIIVNDIPCKSS